MVDLNKILNSEPDYSHLNIVDKAITVNLSKDEQEVILNAYDRGISALPSSKVELLERVIAKLKDEVWL